MHPSPYMSEPTSCHCTDLDCHREPSFPGKKRTRSRIHPEISEKLPQNEDLQAPASPRVFPLGVVATAKRGASFRYSICKSVDDTYTNKKNEINDIGLLSAGIELRLSNLILRVMENLVIKLSSIAALTFRSLVTALLLSLSD